MNMTYQQKIAALTGGFENYSQALPPGNHKSRQDSIFSTKRKTLNALVGSNREQGASTFDVSQISGLMDPSLNSSKITFEDQ